MKKNIHNKNELPKNKVTWFLLITNAVLDIIISVVVTELRWTGFGPVIILKFTKYRNLKLYLFREPLQKLELLFPL